MGFIHNKISSYACALTIMIGVSACAILVLGFLNLGTFHSTEVKSHVGIWLGLIMFINIFSLLLTMGTRRFVVLSSSFVVSIFCLGVCVVAIIFSVEYHDEFKRFSSLNRQQVEGGYCDQSVGDNQCMCFSGRTLQVFRDGFKFQTCPLIHSGEDVWLAMIVLASINAFLSLAGIVLFVVGACWQRKGKCGGST